MPANGAGHGRELRGRSSTSSSRVAALALVTRTEGTSTLLVRDVIVPVIGQFLVRLGPDHSLLRRLARHRTRARTVGVLQRNAAQRYTELGLQLLFHVALARP